MSENPNSITSNFQTTDVEIMRQNILRELGIMHTIKTNKREILLKIQNNKNNKLKLKTGNSALKEILKVREPNHNELKNLIYATAKVVTEECKGSRNRKDSKRRKQIWKEKIEKEIQQTRDLSIISELQKGINVTGRKCRGMIKKYQLTIQNRTSVKETIKQKMHLKAQRTRRYERRSKFYRQNRIFKTDARKVYREVGKEKVTVKDTPPIEKVEEFWKDIWSNTPYWLSGRLTYLLAKTTETYQPKNYRPITCLSTIYMLLTSVITNITYTFIECNDLFPIEQRRCK